MVNVSGRFPLSKPMPLLLLLTANECCPRTFYFQPYIATTRGQHRAQSTSWLALSLALPAAESPLLVSLPHRFTVFSAIVIVSGRLPMSERADATEPPHCGLSYLFSITMST